MHVPWLDAFENIFNIFINLTIHGLELMGVVVVITGAISAFFGYFIRHSPNVRLSLAQSMALGLEFKLGGEILRTVVARDWNEILTVGAIILLRAALNFLIHWEINHIQHDSEIIEHANSPHQMDHAITHLEAEGHITQEQATALRDKHKAVSIQEKIEVILDGDKAEGEDSGKQA